MAGWEYQLYLIGMDWQYLQLLLLDRQLREAEIGQIIHHRLDHVPAVTAVHHQLDVGEELLEFGEDGWQDVDAGGLVGGDHEFPARHAVEFVDRILGPAAQIEDLFGILAQDFARRGQFDARPQALE